MTEILLIEDSLPDADYLNELLSGEGISAFSIQFAARLSEGLRLLNERRFDIVLLDLGLPDSQGLATARAVRQAATKLPVIVLTGLNDEEIALEALKIDIQDYLVKGQITRDVLVRSIQYAIERKRSLTALQESEELFRATYERAPVGIVMVDFSGRFIHANRRLSRMLGYTENELRQMTFMQITVSEDLEGELRLLEYLVNGRIHSSSLEKRYIHKSGRQVWVKETSSIARTFNPYRISIIEDITKRKREEESLKKWGEIFRNTKIGIAVSSHDGKYLEVVNPAFAEMHNYSVEELTGKPLSEVYDPEASKDVAEMIRKADEKGFHVQESFHIRRDGSRFPVLVNITAVKNENGAVLYRIANVQDITEQKKAEEALQFRTYHDLLTGLPNRAQLMLKLDLELAQAGRNDTKLALLHIDLDRFRAINDSLGHAVGDKVILAVSERLRSLIRKSDTLARMGSDEFIILLADLKRAEEAAMFAQLVLDSMRKPFIVNKHELYTTVSIGIGFYPVDGHDSEILLKNADIAVSAVKDWGRNNFQFFNPALNRRTVDRLLLESSLRQSLERGELEVHYQPMMSLRTGRMVAVEALARWRHPDLGLLDPPDFIPVAEEIGFIRTIDDWVLKTAAAQNKAWQESGFPPLCVTVNISGQQFQHPAFIETVRNILTETRLDPKYLDIEITESTAIRDIGRSVPNLDRLHKLGVDLSIDDFGTGYSSLNYLKRFPVNKLKIDKSFIKGIVEDANDQAIVRAIIAMGHTLNLKVIAEGVETDEQLLFLRRSDCDEIQGFLFSEPLPPNQVEELINVNS